MSKITSIITDSWAPYGSTAGVADRVEADFDAERKADRIGYDDIIKTFGWSDADFDTARQYGFPGPTGRVIHGPATGRSIYSRTQILAWRERFQSFASKVTAKKAATIR